MRIKEITACCAITIALMGLLAYFPGWRLMGSFRPDYIPMAPSTSLSFLIFSTAMLFSNAARRKIVHKTMFGLTVLATVFGFLEIVGYLLNLDLNLENQIVPKVGTLNGVPIARMSPSTGFFFFLIGLGTLALYRTSIRQPEKSEPSVPGYTGTITLFGSIVFLLGYLFGHPLLYGQETIPMALTTALGFLFLSLALVDISGVNRFPLNFFQGSSTRSRLMRIFLPLTVGAILSYSIVSRFLDVFVDVNDALGVAFFLVIFSIITAIAVERISRSIGDRLDRSEKRLQEAILRQNEAIRAGNVGLWIWDLKTNRVRYSKEWKRQIGYEENEIGDDFEEWRSRVHPDDLAPTLKEVNQSIAEKRSEHEAEFRFRHKDGSYRWILAQASILRDDNGNPLRMLGSHVDITDSKTAEEKLKAVERRNQALLDHSPVCHKIVDLDFNLQFMSANGFKMLKIDEDADVYGKPYPFDFFPSAFKHEMTEGLNKVKATGDTLTVEALANDSEGSDVWLYSTLMPVLDDEGNIDYITVVTDNVTQRKLSEGEKVDLERQLGQAQKMESVGRLAGGVAHDFNNKLSVILGHSEMALMDMEKEDPHYQMLKNIHDTAKQSADLTRQLLAFARKQTIAPRTLSLNDTIEGMLKMFRRLLGEDIDLAWEPDTNLWQVNMDPSQIDQILANLCVNARDAISGVGKITIETENVTVDESYCAEHVECIPGEYVMLAVSDDGSGMDKETLDNIFEPFFTTKEVDKGTGLGLSTVYGIVKQNNGFVNVYSEPGEGTTFRIYIPRQLADTGDEKAALADDYPRGEGETILLVEDDEKILNLGNSMLKALGYRVLTANSADEALAKVEAEPEAIHLLLTDVVMPRMSGRELADTIKSCRPEIKALFMSGYTANVIAHHGVLNDGVHFIQKPFSLIDLSNKIREVLEGE